MQRKQKKRSNKSTSSIKSFTDAYNNKEGSLTLPGYLSQMPDFRRGQGKMHSLEIILLLVLMATMSGYFGQRATGDFAKKHKKPLIKLFKPKSGKLPAYQTIARVMQHLDYDQLSTIFFSWAKTVVPLEEGEWVSMDGKGINGTLSSPGTSQQSYTNLVSLFASKSKLVITGGKVPGKTNEIPLVQQLVTSLGLTGLIFTADALHCQRATVQAIIESGNDYVIGVKDNQKKLHQRLKKGH